VKECTSEFYGIQTEKCQEGAPKEVLELGRSFKFFEHLEGETMQRRV
jgi:hypothetical protein